MSTTRTSIRAPSRSPSCGPYNVPRTDSRSRPNIFRPSPHTPGVNSYDNRRHSSLQTPSYANGTASSTTRKRARPDSSGRPSLATPYTSYTTPVSPWTHVPSVEPPMMRSDFASPPPLANTTYTIAGGLDTPLAKTEESYFGRQDFHDGGDLGAARRWKNPTITKTPPGQPEIIILGGERNGQGRTYQSSPNGQSWGGFVVAIAGGVAGKLWDFCTTSAFGGFYAGGGGNTYRNRPGPMRRRSTWQDVDESQRVDRSSTPVPGQYPEEDEIEWPESRPAKRQQTETGKGWVMVQDPDLASPEPGSHLNSRRKTTVGTPTAARPNAFRPSLTTRRSLVPVSRKSAGRQRSASPAMRLPVMPSHKRSTSDVTPVKTKPLSPETQKYMAEKKREERQADASIRRLNEQLKAMIKEGKQALGTRVEIVDDVDMEDEGYFEQR
ncbi:hypothetical protein EJ08DRAFT_61598 [Tothia fuscella]|uniref:Uncharacterized protein n=1 Tax=Tothia fuscella TaxID=1048955 RepID=A0A9P4NYX2_9PEZI|nr:hypothetical protein EJ08DRAFT_61598 [Tothia fuscella]